MAEGSFLSPPNVEDDDMEDEIADTSPEVVKKAVAQLLDSALHFLSFCPAASSWVERYAESALRVFCKRTGSPDADHIMIAAPFLMHYLQQLSDDVLQQISPELLRITLLSLQRGVDRRLNTHPDTGMEFHAAWRSLSLRLISSPSPPLQRAGWEQVNKLIQACADHQPPQQYIVSNAGDPVVNGIYEYADPNDAVGGAIGELSYVRRVPHDAPVYSSCTLTIFRAFLLPHDDEYWVISLLDDEAPDTDADWDFYKHPHGVAPLPPCDGWTVVDGASPPPPRLQPVGILPGQRGDTLERELLAWAVENEIVERVFNDVTLHPDVVQHAIVLLQFMVDVSHRNADWTVSGLIPKLCELSRQRRSRNAERRSAGMKFSSPGNVFEHSHVPPHPEAGSDD